MPSRADTAPSCIAPSPESPGSSSWSATTPPHSRWYWSALRSVPACTTGLPSSVNPSAPASRSSAISVSSSPLRFLRDRGQEPDGYLCLPRGGFDQRSEDGGVVDDGVGVRHRDHRAEAAGRRGGRAGLEVLLVLLAGRAQVHVRVDEPGERVHALGVDGVAVLGRLEGSGLAELGDVPVLDEDVVRLVEPGARVEHVGAGDQQLRGLARPVEEALDLAHHATAARLGAPTSNS